MRKESGFTLIELMVTISVLAILASVGIPSMQDFIRNNRRAAAVNAIVTDIQLARGTAASKGVQVIFCQSSTGTDCSAPSDHDWSQGWLVFIDDNEDGTTDPSDRNGVLDANETVLSRAGPRKGLEMPASVGSLRFIPGVRGISTFGGTIAVCVEGFGNDRWIVVNAMGRPQLSSEPRPSASC